MKRRFMWVVVPALLLAGCDPSGEGDAPAPVASDDASATDAPEPDGAQVQVGGARQVVEETDIFRFEYSYPKEAGDIAALAAWLDRRMERTRESLASEATRGRAEARSDGFPFNKYSSGTAWEVVADLENWLSLSADLDSYRGGAHPNYGFNSAVWDKRRDIALEPIAFFDSPEALDEVLGERLCAALDAERERRRGMPVDENSGDTFDECVSPDETNLLLGSQGGERFDRITIQIAPYIAGPYAEGSYEFDFDMDEDLLATVREDYREAFAARN